MRFIIFTGTMQSVEDIHIVTNTCITYNHSLIDFIVYIFSFSINKLVESESLIAVKTIYNQRRTEKQQKTKRTFRAECMRQLKRMNRVKGNAPIHLSGPNAIVYEEVAKCMGTKRRVFNVDLVLANQLAAEEGTLVVNGAGGGGKVKVAVRLRDILYSAV